ncbi:DedA family protein [Streptomyces olivaceiscleroticus]|uniref:VTT domain-containing protein n=1 Tax=Streptomyces olivaceiscleroticus TaxID=68245 RepID=A0ABP3LCY7_9ACTN
MNTFALGPQWLDPDYLIGTFGLIGVLVIVFAESGLLIGFFLPGDSLLFTTGLLVTAGKLDRPLWLVCALIVLAAVLGDQAGYLFGRKVGPSLFKRPDSKLFKQENVEKAHEFFEKHGPKSLILARFVPIVRTFTPIIAGVSRMNYRSFLIFNVIGGALWGAGVTLLGAALGGIEFVHKNIEAILVLIVLISVVPIVIEYLRGRSKAKKAAAAGEDAPAAGPATGGPTDATQPMPRIPQDEDRAPYGTTGGQQRAPYGGGQDGRGGHEAPYGGGQERPPYGHQQQPYGRQEPPYGQGQTSYGQGQAPYGQAQAQAQAPYGQSGQQQAQGQQQYGQGGHGPAQGQQPYGRPEQAAYGQRPQQPRYGRQEPPQAPYGQQAQQPQQPPYGGQSGDAPYGEPAQQQGRSDQYYSPSQQPQQGPQQPHPQDPQQPPGDGRRGRHAKR